MSELHEQGRVAGPAGEAPLPGRWLDLGLAPALGGAGIGPALAWLAGALVSEQILLSWAILPHLLLGLLLVGPLWGRLWGLLSVPLPADDPPPGNAPRLSLPYARPGSPGDLWGRRLGQVWARLWRAREGRTLEPLFLAALLLVVAAIWGRAALLCAVAGLALLLLNRRAGRRPLGRHLLRAFGGIAWPWWLGQSALGSLGGGSLLLSLLWGLAYDGWADSGAPPASRPFLRANLPQAGVVLYLLLAGRPLYAAAVAFALLGQVLLQAGLLRAGRPAEIPRRTWPFAAAGLLLSALASPG